MRNLIIPQHSQEPHDLAGSDGFVARQSVRLQAAFKAAEKQKSLIIPFSVFNDAEKFLERARKVAQEPSRHPDKI